MIGECPAREAEEVGKKRAVHLASSRQCVLGGEAHPKALGDFPSSLLWEMVKF